WRRTNFLPFGAGLVLRIPGVCCGFFAGHIDCPITGPGKKQPLIPTDLPGKAESFPLWQSREVLKKLFPKPNQDPGPELRAPAMSFQEFPDPSSIEGGNATHGTTAARMTNH